MEISNTYNGGPKETGVKTPEKDNEGNSSVNQDNNPKTSGDSQPQEGKEVVNEQEQNDIVNGQGGEGVEEFVDIAASNTRQANDSPLNNENGTTAGSGIAPKEDEDDDDEDDDDDPLKELEIGDDPEEEKKKIPVM
jgi:hypothetical protein